MPKKLSCLILKVCIAIMLISLPVLVVCSYILRPHQETVSLESELIYYPGKASGVDGGVSEKLAYFLSKNDDVIGLLEIEETLLETPVVCSVPEDAYLRRNLDGDYYTAGTPFMMTGTLLGTPGANVIIFGHNMPDGTLFGALMGYKELSYTQEHPVIKFESILGVQNYHVISAFYADATDTDFVYASFTQLTNTSSVEYLRQVRLRSLYDVPLKATASDQYITLSTCTYEDGGTNGRFVVVGRMLYDDEQVTSEITQARAPLLPGIFRGRV